MSGIVTAQTLWPWMRRCWVPIAGSVFLAVLQSLSLVPVAWLIRDAFDRVIPARSVTQLLYCGGGLLALNLLSSIFGLIARSLSLRAAKASVATLRRDLIAHWYALPRSFHDAADHGKMHALIVQDTESVDVMINAVICSVLPALMLSTALAIVLLALNPVLFGALLLVLPALYLVSRVLHYRVREQVQQFRRSLSSFSSAVGFAINKLDLTR